MTSGIYKIINVTNEKFYIGSAKNIEKRWERHRKDLKLNNHQNIHLQRAYNKQWGEGFEFIVLEEREPCKLIECEQFYLDMLKPEYNICKIANSSLGVKRTDDFKRKLRAANLGKKHSEEHKNKIALKCKGRKLSEKHILSLKLHNTGKKHSDETKEKIRKIRIGSTHSDETKLKMSDRMKGHKINNGRKQTREHIEARMKNKRKTDFMIKDIINLPM